MTTCLSTPYQHDPHHDNPPPRLQTTSQQRHAKNMTPPPASSNSQKVDNPTGGHQLWTQDFGPWTLALKGPFEGGQKNENVSRAKSPGRTPASRLCFALLAVVSRYTDNA